MLEPFAIPGLELKANPNCWQGHDNPLICNLYGTIIWWSGDHDRVGAAFVDCFLGRTCHFLGNSGE